MNEQLKYIERIESEFLKVIQNRFPNNFIQNWGSSGPYFHAHFATKNLYFKDTEYYYENNFDFFHLTTYRNLFSILNSRVIRMYNLHNANDPEEFEFSARLFSPTEQEIKHRKNNLYTFSFCPISELQNKNVWEKYGQDYKGVAISFKIENDYSKWDNFHISEIKYRLSKTLQSYVNDIDILRKQYPECTFYLELEKFMAFHKRENWQDEKEVRILTYNPYKSLEEKLKYTKRELKIEQNRNRFTEYIDLHLWADNDSSYLRNRNGDPMVDRRQSLPISNYFETHPKIRITNIYFGYNCGLTPPEYYKFKIDIEDLIRYNFGYRVDVANNLFKP